MYPDSSVEETSVIGCFSQSCQKALHGDQRYPVAVCLKLGQILFVVLYCELVLG